jgi:hypothetical protein
MSMPGYVRPIGFPVLTPMYGLGSGARTSAAILISSPRCRIGTQGRCYAYAKSRGQGEQYIQYILATLGNQPVVDNSLSIITA